MTAGIKWRLAAGVAVVFFAGVATGLFSAAWHMHHRAFFGHDAGVGLRMREHFRRELRLTPEQTEKLAPVIEATASRLEKIRVETGQRVAQAMEDSRDQIAPHLNPEQRARLDEIEKRHRRALQSGRLLPHPPPPDAP